jgi:hypothetical protein
MLYITTLVAFFAGFYLDGKKALALIAILSGIDIILSWIIVRVLNSLIDAFD